MMNDEKWTELQQAEDMAYFKADLCCYSPESYSLDEKKAICNDMISTSKAALDAMRAARLHAMASGTEARFVVALRERRFGAEGVPGAAAHELPAPLEMHAEMAAQEEGEDGSLAVRFLPQGGASGGSLDILRPSGSGVRLRVNWFTGRVEQETLQP